MPGLILLVFLVQAAPEPAPKAPPRVREDVVVTAERAPEPRASVPAAVSVLTREEIERLPAENLAELMRFLPGFHVHFAPAAGGVAIVSSRGFFGGGEAEYVQLLVDGVPVADAESGLADWRRIRARDVERIEALRGPASSLYGDTALGGLIQVFTRRDDRTLGGGISTSGGSFRSAAVDGSAFLPMGGANLAASVGVSATDGFRDHGASRDANADVSIDLPTAATGKVTLSVSGSRRDRDEPGPRTREELATDRFGSDPLFRMDREETSRGRVSAAYRVGGETFALRALAWGSARDTDATRTLLVAPGLGDRIHRAIETDAIGASVESEKTFTLSGRPFRAVGGADFARERLDSVYRAVGPAGDPADELARASGRRERLGVFFSGAWEPAARLRITAGGRWDSIEDDFRDNGSASRRAWSPRAGVSLLLGEPPESPPAVFVQWSRAFKAPTLDQLFDPRPFSDFAGGTFRISNPRLEPQRAETFEAGVSRRGLRSSFELVVYRTEVDDEIDFDLQTFRYANIGRTRHVGVEAAAALFPRGAVSPSISYAWTRTEPLEGEHRGRQLKNIAEHLVRPGLAIALPARVRLDASATILAGRYLDDANRFPIDDAVVVDLRAERSFGEVRARLDLLNLTDRDWEELGLVLTDFRGETVPYYFPAAGFAARLGLDWTF